MRATRARGGVRERLLDAAGRLFYAEGVNTVGIDRILGEAGAAKASLYCHFDGKDDLIAQYAAARAEAARVGIDAHVAAAPPAARGLAFFDWVVAWVESPGFRGCPLQQVVAEVRREGHPAREVVAAQRRWLLGRFSEWAAAAGSDAPEETAGAMLVLFDGAVASSAQDGPQRAHDARRLAADLLGDAARRRPSGPRGRDPVG